MSTQLTFFFAFLVVLALIGAAAWLVRRFASDRLKANSNRGRMPRLAVIDATAVDGRRRLVLVRRDNIEHLLMIGGPSDIVVESNIVRAMPSRDQVPPRANVAGGETPPRIAPFPDFGNDGDTPGLDEPQMPEPQPRPARPSFADEVRRPAPGLLERREPLAGFTPDTPTRPEPVGRPEPRPEMRSEPMPPRAPPRNEPMMPRPPLRPSEPPPRAPPLRAPERAVPPPPHLPPAVSADQNLADMAHRLEAALRRPADGRPESGEPRIGAPPVAPEAPSGRPSGRGDASTILPSSGKGGFENLEDEMASLLGRPKTPS